MSLSDLVFWGRHPHGVRCVLGRRRCRRLSASRCGFGRPYPWNTASVREIMIVSAFVGLAGVLVWIGLLLWAAREDGRDQQRREYLRGR